MHLKDVNYLLAKGYIKSLKDTIDVEADVENEDFDKIKKDKPRKNFPTQDSASLPEALLPKDNKRGRLDSL
jgi:hypothetical protein